VQFKKKLKCQGKPMISLFIEMLNEVYEMVESKVFVEPKKYSLRGDSALWKRLSNINWNNKEKNLLYQEILTEIEKYITKWESDPYYVKNLDDSNGMSRGYVDPHWWMNTALPLLKKRLGIK
jgi:hypothetical protein